MNPNRSNRRVHSSKFKAQVLGGFLRRQHRKRGSSEGMVEASIAAFRGAAAGTWAA